MRKSIGVYEHSGWPGYFDEDGDGFPDNWVIISSVIYPGNSFYIIDFVIL